LAGALFVAAPMLPAVMGFAVGLVICQNNMISRGWCGNHFQADISVVCAVN
jgi:hypothetical protein